MNYLDYLSPGRIILPAEISKSEIIIQLAEKAATEKAVKDSQDLAEKLFYREQLMSTGIGLGLGIPHVRYAGVSAPYIGLAVQKEGISDYESLDGSVVRAAMMILVGEGEHRSHVRLLSQITRHFKQDGLMDRICAMDNSEDIYEALKETFE